MKELDRIQRLQELLKSVIQGLDGLPFTWGNGQRMAWVPMLKEAGVTLITKTQIEKCGYRLKRSAKPVGCAYFGAPIKAHIDLYVLEVQCTKPKPPDTDCWLFLDCEQMTGLPAEECPNRKNCKQNALHSANRSCYLPYQRWLPKTDQLFEVPTLQVLNDASREAQAVGWCSSVQLFYSYRPGEMVIGKVPVEAQAFGFESAVHLPYSAAPYYWDIRISVLMVVFDVKDPRYQDAIRIGWYPPDDLPYEIFPKSKEYNFSVLTVRFSLHDTRYADAIRAGWYSACELSDSDLGL